MTISWSPLGRMPLPTAWCYPDLAPSDYYLFPKMTKELGGHHFARNDDVMNAVVHLLRYQNGAFYTEVTHLLSVSIYVEKLMHLIF